jgi:putative hydrolase of the HAD superfamily
MLRAAREEAIGGIRAVFSDVGGVLGTNGWDHGERIAAVREFGLDPEEFRTRHELVVTAFETGRLTLEDYLQRTVFYRPRSFTLQAFRDFMFSQSKPYPETLALMERVARSGQCLLATLNNESLELNLHRIRAFGLPNIFKLFLSSCFVGVKKPDAAIYRLALQLTQQEPAQCVFIDDRALNLECAGRVGMHTIQFQTAAQLALDLRALGIES